MSYNKKVWKSGDRITKEALNNMENGIEAAHQNSGGTGSAAIVDNLNSDSSTSALSAKQGKALNNKIPTKSIVEGGKLYLAKEDGTKLDSGTELPAGGSTIEVVNNLESDSTTAALSAAQGKALNTQYKDSVNKTEVVDGKLYLLKSDGTRIDKGTILPTSSGTVTSNNIETYKCEDLGELYSAPSDYTAWCPGNLRFDKVLNKFVALLYCAPAHIHTTADLYVSYINTEDFVATSPVKCKYVDSDGVTDITPSVAGTTAFMILEDGTYMMLHNAGNNTYRFISSDSGLTWKKNELVSGYNSQGSPWSITKLSDGRLICGDDLTKVGIYYSDDEGINWTQVIPGNEGIGDYVAEAHIIELKQNNLIAIARKSMDGYGYNNSTVSDHAIISYSTDNGTTWSDWKDSVSIDNMEASCCTSIVHDGIVEIFACSRWHKNDNKANLDYTNTGKNGAMFHYVATIDSALKDNFTNLGVVVYAKASNSDDFHSPCLSLDNNNNILIMYMDKGGAATCNHSFIRGELGYLSYKPLNTNSSSSVNPYSAKYTELLFSNMLEKVNSLQYALSRISGSGVTPPSGTLIWTKQYNAKDAGKSILDTSLDIANYITGIEPSYTQHNNLYCTDLSNGFICMKISKQNCAFDIKVSSINEKTQGAYGVGFGLLKDGILYYFPFINNCDKLEFSSNKIAEIKVVFNGTNISEAKWDAVDIKNLFITYNDLNSISTNNIAEVILKDLKTKLGTTEIPTTGTYLLVKPVQMYLSWYEVKLGEWDS